MRNKSIPQPAAYTTHQGRCRTQNIIKDMGLPPRLISSHVGYFVSMCISLLVCVLQQILPVLRPRMPACSKAGWENYSHWKNTSYVRFSSLLEAATLPAFLNRTSLQCCREPWPWKEHRGLGIYRKLHWRPISRRSSPVYFYWRQWQEERHRNSKQGVATPGEGCSLSGSPLPPSGGTNPAPPAHTSSSQAY